MDLDTPCIELSRELKIPADAEGPRIYTRGTRTLKTDGVRETVRVDTNSEERHKAHANYEGRSVNLQRFKEAQSSPYSGFQSALAEIQSGGKRGHWIWYVFPQLEGLGFSELARAFAIHGAEEAEAFLRDDQLRTRLLTITRAVADQLSTGGAASLRALMGSEIDARKVVSSLTLFRQIVRTLDTREPGGALAAFAEVADEVLTRASADGYPPCVYTLRYLTRKD